MLGRLEGVKSAYGYDVWFPDFTKNLVYKDNLTRTTNPNILVRNIKTS